MTDNDTEPLPRQTDNSPRPVDGPQDDVSQDPDVDLSEGPILGEDDDDTEVGNQ